MNNNTFCTSYFDLDKNIPLRGAGTISLFYIEGSLHCTPQHFEIKPLGHVKALS